MALLELFLLHDQLTATKVFRHKNEQERKIIKNEKRYRNGGPKSTQTRKDHKSDGKYTVCVYTVCSLTLSWSLIVLFPGA